MIYATTPSFLAHFGLASRRDLPGIDELRAVGLLDPIDDAIAALIEPETAPTSLTLSDERDTALAKDCPTHDVEDRD